MTRLEEMILTFFPTARPDSDFAFKEHSDGTFYLAKWDELKLGEKPDLTVLRKHFLDYIERKSKVIPTIDTTDPAPWLADDRIEEFETSKERIHIEPSENRLFITRNGTILKYR